MTNDERRKNDKARMTNDLFAATRIFSDVVILSLLRHSTFELRHSQHVSQLGLLRFEVFNVMRIGLGANGHLLNHFEAIALKADNFLWIICEKPKLPHAEIEKNLRPKSVIAEVARVTKLGVGFHGIETFLLQFVRVNFCRQPNSPSFLAHVNQNAVTLLLDLPQRRMQLIPAVAAPRSENVAGETLAVHPHQRRFVLVDVALDQREMMLPVEL